MLAKLIPIIFLLLGVGAGVGAGIFLAPESSPEATKGSNASMEVAHSVKKDAQGAEIDTAFVKMNNQFVVPVVQNDRIAALVVVSLSLETQNGLTEFVYEREPKLRDGFLRVMFDHANMGGFHGAFTDPETLDLLCKALLDVAQKELGSDVLDVLIIDIIRQDT